MSNARDLGDSAAIINFIDGLTSDVQQQLNTLDPLPSQTGQSGKYLTTDGTDASWGTVTTDPTLGTLTKTFTNGESASISLTSSVLAPVVSVTKEVPQTGSTNNSWDVNSTTENYTRLDSAPATTLDWVANDDVSAATETSITLSGATQSTGLLGGTIGNTGQNAYMLDQTDGTIYQYSLSVAYDLSSGSYESKTFNVLSQQSDPRNIFFKTDGTVLYVIGTTNQAIYQYSLSTAWDISTASYDSKTFSASSQSNGTSGLFIKPDGSKLYIVAYSNDAVYQYSLSTAWDISTASYDSVSLSVSSQDSTPRDITFNDDGTVLYMCGTGNNALYQYELTTAYDLSSASYSSNTLSLSTTVFSITYSSASLQLVIFQSLTDILKTIRLSNTLTLGTGSFASADVGKTIEASSGEFVLTATDGSYVEITAPTSYAQVASGSWEMYGVVYNAADGDLELSSYIEGYKLSSASYDSVSYNASSEIAGMGNIAFNNDGTKLYIVDWSAQDINEFSLSTAFDVSTASFSKRQSTSSWETDPKTIAFNNDGTKMFLAGGSGDDVNEYTLSTAFDISTLSYVASFSFSGQESNVASITFNNDGTKLYVVGATNDTVYQYTLSSAFTVSTASYDSVSLSVGSYDGNPQQIAFNSDGTKFYFVGLGADQVHQYSLSAAFDLSTASYDSVVFSVASQTTTPRGLWFNTTGNKMFIGGDDIVYQYSTGSFYFPTGYQPVHTTASTDTEYWTDINSMTANQAAGDGNVYYAISTDDRTTWSVIDNTDGERDIVRNNAGTWQYNSNATYASETWVNGATNTELATIAEAMEGAALVSGFNIADTGSVESSFSVSPFTQPNGVRFNTDGTKMFIMGYSIDEVRQYSLSTAYDVSTSSYDNVSFSISSTAPSSRGFNFNSDGSKMYVVDSSLDSVVEYDLSTGFDLSTASYNSVSFDISSELAEPQDIVFNNNGTKMYVIGFATDSIFQYSLSTAYDISTASYDSVTFSVAGQSSTPTSLYFSNDGLFLFVLGYTNTKVYQYNLTTAYDISTASYSGTFESIANEPNPRGLTFNNNGTKMYVVGNGNDTVYQWSVGTTTSYTNQMDKTQLDAVADPNHIALGDDLDLAIVFNMTSGSTVPSSDGVAINYDANVLNKGAVLGTDYDFDAPAQNSVRITALAGNNLKIRII
jgi:6-phosphogluconolactonase (cycloisomerase 2 family)